LIQEIPRLILASASPRRRELMALFGLPYEVEPSRYEEPGSPSEPVNMAEFVSHLATNKALDVAKRVGAGWVIGADTEVALETGELGTPLGKPHDPADARRMVAQLAGRWHTVSTGIAVIQVVENEIVSTHAEAVHTRVKFRELTEAMIADYVATGEPLDKAGAYGAQGYAAPFIEAFDGDFFNVVGLPLCALGQLLERAGLNWSMYRSAMPPIIG
jgi:septum formation protein